MGPSRLSKNYGDHSIRFLQPCAIEVVRDNTGTKGIKVALSKIWSLTWRICNIGLPLKYLSYNSKRTTRVWRSDCMHLHAADSFQYVMKRSGGQGTQWWRNKRNEFAHFLTNTLPSPFRLNVEGNFPLLLSRKVPSKSSAKRVELSPLGEREEP